MHMPIRGFLMSTCGWVSTFGKQKTKSTNTRLCPIIIIIPILITRLCPISRGFARPFAPRSLLPAHESLVILAKFVANVLLSAPWSPMWSIASP